MTVHRYSQNVGARNLHFEGETHLGLHARGEDLEEELDEGVLVDAAVRVALACQCVEAVGDNAREIDILDERHLVDGLLRVGLGLGRTEGKVGEDAGEVRFELASNELRVNFRVEILHIEKVNDVDGLLGWAGRVTGWSCHSLLNVEGCGDGLLRRLLRWCCLLRRGHTSTNGRISTPLACLA